MHRVVQVGIAFNVMPDQQKLSQLDRAVTAIADDWVRYSAMHWLLWTDRPAPHIYTVLMPYLALPSDFVLIAGVKMDDSFGYLPTFVWEWISQKAGGQGVITEEQAELLMRTPAALLSKSKGA